MLGLRKLDFFVWSFTVKMNIISYSKVKYCLWGIFRFKARRKKLFLLFVCIVSQSFVCLVYLFTTLTKCSIGKKSKWKWKSSFLIKLILCSCLLQKRMVQKKRKPLFSIQLALNFWLKNEIEKKMFLRMRTTFIGLCLLGIQKQKFRILN